MAHKTKDLSKINSARQVDFGDYERLEEQLTDDDPALDLAQFPAD